MVGVAFAIGRALVAFVILRVLRCCCNSACVAVVVVCVLCLWLCACVCVVLVCVYARMILRACVRVDL